MSAFGVVEKGGGRQVAFDERLEAVSVKELKLKKRDAKVLRESAIAPGGAAS